MHKGFVYSQTEVERCLAGQAAQDMGWNPEDVSIRVAVIGPGAIIVIASLATPPPAAPLPTIEERLSAFPWLVELNWPRCEVPGGKNRGKLLAELDNDSISWYYTNAVDKPTLATKDFLKALDDWAAWKASEQEKMQESRGASPPEPERGPGLSRAVRAALEPAAQGPRANIVDATRAPEPAAPVAETTPVPDPLADTGDITDYGRQGPFGDTPPADDGRSRRPEGGAYKDTPDAVTFGTTPEVGVVVPAGPATIAPPTKEPTTKQKAAQEKLKAKKIVKKPAKASEKASATLAPPEPKKPVEPPPRAFNAANWREYINPIGDPREKGGTQGVPLGELPLSDLREMKEFYLDRRQWDNPETLKPYDLDLKACVEAGILNDGKPAEVKKPTLPAGPIADLYLRMEEFFVNPDALLKILQAADRLGPLYVSLGQITEQEAGDLLNAWDGVMDLYEGTP